MKLHIQNDLRLRDLQMEFSSYFPQLRLEFYNLPHEIAANTYVRCKLPPEAPVCMCRENNREGALFIHKDEKIAELERDLGMRFGLYAQIFWEHGFLSEKSTLRQAMVS